MNYRFFTPHAYQKLTTDVTSFKTQEVKKLYFSPILGPATSEILPFSMSHPQDLTFVVESLTSVLPILEQSKIG